MDSRFRGNDGGFFLFSGGIAGDFLRRIPPFFPNSAPPPSDSRRQIPASPPSFPRTRESIFTDKIPISRRFFRCTPIPFPANVLRCLANVLRGLRNVLRCLGNVLRGLRNVLRCLKNVLRGLRNVLRTLFFRRRSPKNAVFQHFTHFLPNPPVFLRIRAECVILSQTFLSERKSNEKHNQ